MAVMCCDTVHRGLSYANGRLFLQQADTTLVALDPASGQVLWSVKNGDPGRGETNTATVLPVGDTVIVGLSGGEYGARCPVTAYDQATGHNAGVPTPWGRMPRSCSIPRRPRRWASRSARSPPSPTWEGDQWKIGGGCAWGWFSYDAALNLVYYGTSNPSTWNPAQRPGDNRWAEAIIARDADTGVARWVYQMTPHDQWDFDGVNEMILTEQEIGGTRRKVADAFRPQRLRLHPRPGDRRAPRGGEVRPQRQLGDEGRAGSARRITDAPSSPSGSPPRRPARRRSRRASARGARRQEPAARRLLAADGLFYVPTTTCAWITSRSASPTPPASPMSARR